MKICSEHLKLYIYIWCELLTDSQYDWNTVNLDKQTLDIGVLRKKNYSLFLECTFDMNNCFLFFVEKKII